MHGNSTVLSLDLSSTTLASLIKATFHCHNFYRTVINCCFCIIIKIRFRRYRLNSAVAQVTRTDDNNILCPVSRALSLCPQWSLWTSLICDCWLADLISDSVRALHVQLNYTPVLWATTCGPEKRSEESGDQQWGDNFQIYLWATRVNFNNRFSV